MRPRIGVEAARLIAAAQADAAVGVVELNGLPAGITGDLRPGWLFLKGCANCERLPAAPHGK